MRTLHGTRINHKIRMTKKPLPTIRDGLMIPRIFSAEGENPLDSVQWERRDAVIKNPQGDSVFEQRNVEFPVNWSALATNVVASKYFYGDLDNVHLEPDEGGRETSLRQLVHRVTRTIADWGKARGYFASAADAERFYDELTWLCIHQHGAFNSPVWFNVGLKERYGVEDTGGRSCWGWDEKAQRVEKKDPYEYPQGSACFIISVEDSIDDIWRVMSESARLFKYGSGVGADWSKLRSTHEKLSGGGVPSGPVSFMRVQDSTGGTIKSGGKTRRAAIMQTLKIGHPDIEEFIRAKREEEAKAWALIEQGYDGSFNGPAYGSVAFQNVNQSVRVTDAFMTAVQNQERFELQKVQSGDVVRGVKAARLLTEISAGTHLCGDPGVQYEDTIQAWHTCKASGPINSSNPCSEYMFLDDSACNLASLNLIRFLEPDNPELADSRFNVRRFRAATRIFITAMEIIVDRAGYPSKAIAQNSHDYRPLGLGFANLGALLMSMGVPYDSREGRAVAGALMAIEHAEAYARSAEIAANKKIGPFPAYKPNAKPMQAVIAMHRAAGEDIDLWEQTPDLRDAALASLQRMVELGKRHGFRNSQVTVLAPTGTIAFMMDCDTTGIEPDIALVKYKLLAGKGDGTLKIVNQSVRSALTKLGYPPERVDGILEYIDEHDTIEGAPGLSEEHLAVFDCAFKPFKGSRSVSSMGHIRMMAACQPFVSGAISKTVNMPEDVTIEEISNAYMEGWNLGLKALAIYRENSKRSQPLSTSQGGNTQTEAALASSNGQQAHQPVRRRLPDDRLSIAHKFSVGGHEGYLHVGLYPDTNMPGEIFIRMSKVGSIVSGMMDAFATAISVSLQYGVPLEDICRKYMFMRFEPNGYTSNPQIPQALSILDYIARFLSITFLESPSLPPAIEHTFQRLKGSADDETNILSPPPAESTIHMVNAEPVPAVISDTPICVECGAITIRSGACYVCTQCGSSSGCG